MSETNKTKQKYICNSCGTEFEDANLQKGDVLKIFQYKSIAGYLLLILAGAYLLMVFEWMSGGLFLWLLLIVLVIDGYRALRRAFIVSQAYREGRCPSCWGADYKNK